MPGKQNAISIFQSALAAVDPSQLIRERVTFSNETLVIDGHSVSLQPHQRIFVIGAGKASAAMAVELETLLGDRIYRGLITTKYHHTQSMQYIQCLEAGHPIPDQQSIDAAQGTIELLKQANEHDVIICLLSGGASALWSDIPDTIHSTEMFLLFELLLKSGCDITETNTVRKHLSRIKGGQLLKHAPSALWFSLVLSDVPGDDLSVIASGPTVADNSSFADALNVMMKYGLSEKAPSSIMAYLQKGNQGLITETLKPHDILLQKSRSCIIGNNSKALHAASLKAKELKYHIHNYEKKLQGDAGTFGSELIRFCKSYSGQVPACIIVGGETTVNVTGNGKGGRNQQMALGALLEMRKRNDTETASITFLSAGTDGTDGPTDAAGAIADIEVLAMAVQKGLDATIFFDNCDAYSFFKQTGGLLKTGPTLTNVMDIVIVLIE